MKALVCLVLLASVAAAEPRGYDHAAHEALVDARGAELPACSACHQDGPRGVPARVGHAGCLVSGCHAPLARGARAPASRDDERVCLACHAELPVPRKAVMTPWSPLVREHALELSHAAHAEARCETCHRAGQPPAPGHARCAACHDARAMATCGTCHRPVVGRAGRPELVRSSVPVTGRFDHRAHGKHPAPCQACHSQLASGPEVPAPRAADCAGCHDGKAAFAVTEQCTRCHAPRLGALPPAPSRPFEHAQHQGDCSACHGLTSTGRPRPSDHAACAGCHAADFGAPQPVICGTCHVGREPWRKLAVDRPFSARTAFGVEYSHARHPDLPCSGCHTGIPAVLVPGARSLAPMRLGTGHDACATCHQLASGPAPRLASCTACHVAGLLPARDARRRQAQWSVAERFGELGHQRHAQASCQTCHTQVAQADSVAAIVPPPKASCRPCHDGKIAFKTTGTGCARCHR